MANLNYIERLSIYTASLESVVYNYKADYTYEHQCTLIKALLELTQDAIGDTEYELVGQEEKENINRIIGLANAILNPVNI